MQHRSINHRLRLGALALASAWLLAGCADYDESDGDSATGGSAGLGGATDVGGSAGQTGDSGGTGGAATGGTGGAATGGTGGGEASCTNVTACGGDVVGTWNVTSSCLTVTGEVDVMGFGLGCTSAPVTGSLQVSGTWTANGDGTYSDETNTSGNETLDLPASCLNVSGTTTTCDRISGPLMALGYAAVECLDATSGGCTCAATVQQTGGIGLVVTYAPASGNYTASGNVITTASGDLQYSYCVSGSALTMTPQSESPKTTTGTVVLQKQ